MKTIKVDEIEYVKKEDYDSLKETFEEYKKKNKGETPTFTDSRYVTDPAHVLGFGTVKLQGKYYSSKFSISYIEKALRIFKTMEKQEVRFFFGDDYPLFMGLEASSFQKIEEDTFVGLILAPRVTEDESSKKKLS